MKLRIADLHQDISFYLQNAPRNTPGFDVDAEGRHGDIPKYRRAGIRLVFSAIFPAIGSWNPRIQEMLNKGYGFGYSIKPLLYRGGLVNVLEHIKIYYRMARAYSEIEIVDSARDFEDLENNEKIGFLISLEGADPLEDPEDLEVLARLGVKSLTITWNYDNRYASSCMSRRDYGLTGEGEYLVEKANELGVILDISHAGRKTSLEVLNISKLPVIASHSNYMGRRRHVRNVDDEILEGIKRSGGVVGFTMITSTIADDPSIDDLVKHIVDVKERFGSDILAIGTDYFGIETTPKGLEDVSKLPNLLSRLRDSGFSENDISKLSWENIARVIRIHASRW